MTKFCVAWLLIVFLYETERYHYIFSLDTFLEHWRSEQIQTIVNFLVKCKFVSSASSLLN